MTMLSPVESIAQSQTKWARVSRAPLQYYAWALTGRTMWHTMKAMDTLAELKSLSQEAELHNTRAHRTDLIASRIQLFSPLIVGPIAGIIAWLISRELEGGIVCTLVGALLAVVISAFGYEFRDAHFARRDEAQLSEQPLLRRLVEERLGGKLLPCTWIPVGSYTRVAFITATGLREAYIHITPDFQLRVIKLALSEA